MEEAAEYAVAKVVAAMGDADMAMQRWGCGMYLRLASVQYLVTSDAGNIERLLVAASGCLQRMRSAGCTGLIDVTWRLRLYEGYVPEIRGDYDVKLALLQALEADFADSPRAKMMAATLNNIGTMLDSKGEHDKAVEYHTRALDIKMERLGPRHPHVASSLSNIGNALDSKGEHDKAVEYHTRALDNYMERLGPRQMMRE
jgi:tetratricopeptide (TPR) repeat protein